MLKKTLLGTLIVVLSSGVALGSASAAPSDTNDINATIEGGALDLDMDQGAVNFTGTINHKSNSLNITAEDAVLNYTAYDNRGIDEDFKVSHTLGEFTEEDSDATLTVTGTFEDTDSFGEEIFDPKVTSSPTSEIDLTELDFSTDGLVEAGTYTSIMTTTVEASPEV